MMLPTPTTRSSFLLKHVPNNNGKVGIWGISYPGFYTSASMIDSHPALVAASPQAPMTDLFLGDDGYHGGAFMLSANFGFYAPFFHPQNGPQTPKQTAPFDFGTPDSYQFYLKAGNIANLDKMYLKGSNWLFNDQAKHDTYDAYWQARDLSRHMKNVKCAVLVVGGWYRRGGSERTVPDVLRDIEVQSRHADDAGGGSVGARRMGARRRHPSGRCAVRIEDRASIFGSNIQFPFFEHYLKGKGAAQPKAVVFETGTNVWRHFDEWPPKAATAKMLYFHAGGKLSFDPPTEVQSRDDYESDPNHPVPFVGYTTDTVPQRYMVDDQRFASERPDVLTYVTDPLEEDVTIAGPISPKLKVASSSTDSDFDVKLIDVYPDDYPDATRPDSAEQARSGCTAAAHGRISAIAARRAVPRQVPQQLGEAGAAGAGEDDGHQLHHAGSVSHLPARAPHHGAGAEFVVPADGSQSADLYRYSQHAAGAVYEGDRAGVSSEGRGVGG